LGFKLALLFGFEGGGAWLSLGDLRTPGLSLRVTRDDAGVEEFDSFI
jgi:hypothetical protein